MVATNVDRFGFLRWHPVPVEGWGAFWSRIFVDPDIKQRLLRFARLVIDERPRLDSIGLPISGTALLTGPPGTGKTSLVRGLADALGCQLGSEGRRVLFAEVDGHALPSQMLGESQRNVAHLLGQSVPELAENADAAVVLIDEIDGFAVNRVNAASGSDPIDVVRATEAVLQGMDDLAALGLPLVVVGTTNFPMMLDEAFVDRVDLVEHVGLPDEATVERILADSLMGLANGSHADASTRLAEVASAAVGLSARDVRRVCFRALLHMEEGATRSPEPHELLDAIKQVRG